MTQNAVITELISPGLVRVSLKRQLACGSGCPSCKGCISQQPEDISAIAEDTIGLELGEWVELETNAGNSVAISLMVYFLPCITMLLGYILGRQFGLGEGVSLIPAVLGIGVGFLPAKLLDHKIRHQDTPEFTITKRKQV
ncbi:MAG: SoxR reducing system RseC family protein [Eubacteriales bacterium]